MEDVLIPLITFLLVIGSSVFKSKSNQSKEDQRRSEQRPKQTPTVSNPNPGRVDPIRGEAETEMVMPDGDHQDQLERLRESLNLQSEQKQAQKNSQAKKIERRTPLKSRTNKKRKTANSSQPLKKQLLRGGVRSSVVMAEVLSKPRAKRPYGRNNQI
ncbi:hypothetical protein DES38_10450 [Streptohalobacillus salinus]|uniref:Uncharacterized protein n=1 Tax=Streptohalobacillus salinus TaxID=621096 RepID=A0A2V3WEP8_9BACI|nr:hypothetical protein [Streptohalobacillus salinus]PXW91624.1 hypothetical protein DES38_10450 [Streptohalobacillus salinus]